MQTINIKKNEDGQRLERILMRFLPGAGKGFIYKMLRKKNIVLNGKKAEGNEKLSEGDVITLFLSDQTIEGFKKPENSAQNLQSDLEKRSSFDLASIIVYENSDIILVNKPVGMLTQKAEAGDISLNEHLINYMLKKGQFSPEDAETFRPSVCNRLDRNTGGLVACGKTLAGLRALSEMFRDRSLGKYYLCIVKGRVDKPGHLRGFIKKDEKTNRVEVLASLPPTARPGDYDRIETKYQPLKVDGGASLLEVELLTGKTHQIRAHLASIGHPIGGDHKYGDEAFNHFCREKYKVREQLLFAYKLVFPEKTAKGLPAGRIFTIDAPGDFFISL